MQIFLFTNFSWCFLNALFVYLVVVVDGDDNEATGNSNNLMGNFSFLPCLTDTKTMILVDRLIIAAKNSINGVYEGISFFAVRE